MERPYEYIFCHSTQRAGQPLRWMTKHRFLFLFLYYTINSSKLRYLWKSHEDPLHKSRVVYWIQHLGGRSRLVFLTQSTARDDQKARILLNENGGRANGSPEALGQENSPLENLPNSRHEQARQGLEIERNQSLAANWLNSPTWIHPTSEYLVNPETKAGEGRLRLKSKQRNHLHPRHYRVLDAGGRGKGSGQKNHHNKHHILHWIQCNTDTNTIQRIQ